MPEESAKPKAPSRKPVKSKAGNTRKYLSGGRTDPVATAMAKNA